jgi:tetratricopeptide (TPR) repeat protein
MCWQAEMPQDSDTSQGNLDKTPSDGAIEGVYKLYWLGKVHFSRYWVLSGYGQKDNPEAIEDRNKAEQYLLAALKLPWSQENKNQKKDFIAELLARVYITMQLYDKASEIIRKYRSHYWDVYVMHTFALSLLLAGKHKEARKTLEEASTNKGNKDLWTTYFLQGCSHLNEGQLEEAKRLFEKADNEARKHGKENLDSLLIGQAFVSYKSQNRPEAVNYLQQAAEMNPHRLSVQKHLESWRAE